MRGRVKARGRVRVRARGRGRVIGLGFWNMTSWSFMLTLSLAHSRVVL